jgi:hypothetical protein
MGVVDRLGRLMVRQAAKLLDAKDPGATVMCAMAKKTATDIGFQVGHSDGGPHISGLNESVSDWLMSALVTGRRWRMRPSSCTVATGT